MEDHKVRIVVTKSGCPRYKVVDEIYFDGAFIDKERSAVDKSYIKYHMGKVKTYGRNY